MRVRFAVVLLAPALLVGATDQTSGTSSKTSSSKTVHKSRKSRYAGRKRKPAGSAYQTHPTAERYKAIQQALAEKGYFKGSVDGSWGDDSVDALKRFQTDHKLENDGKISSLSLIQLGLGPKHDGSTVTTAHPELPDAPPPPVTEAPPETSQSAQ